MVSKTAHHHNTIELYPVPFVAVHDLPAVECSPRGGGNIADPATDRARGTLFYARQIGRETSELEAEGKLNYVGWDPG